MLSIILASRLEGNANHNLEKFLTSIERNASRPGNIEVLVNCDHDDNLIEKYLPFTESLTVKVVFMRSDRGRGYADLNRFYNELMLLVSPKTQVVCCMTDDFIVTRPGFDHDIEMMVESLKEYRYYIIHQPRKGHTLNFNPRNIGNHHPVDPCPMWSKELLEVVGGLGLTYATDAWTLCLEYYLHNEFCTNVTGFLPEMIVQRLTNEKIDGRNAPRWTRERTDCFNYMSTDFYQAVVREQARSIFLRFFEAKVLGNVKTGIKDAIQKSLTGE